MKSDTLLVLSEPGTEGELFAKELFSDEALITIMTDKSFKGNGLSLKNELIERKPLSDFEEKITREIKKHKESVICLNNASTIIDFYGEEGLSMINRLINLSLSGKNKFVSLFTDWPYDKSLINKLRKQFNNEIRIKSINNSPVRRVITDNNELLFRVNTNGLELLKNNVIVIGPEKTGKTTIVKSFNDDEAVFDRLSNHFLIDRAEFKGVDFFGAPANKSGEVLNLLSNEASRILVIIDGSKPETFNESINFINKSIEKGLKTFVGLRNAPEESIGFNSNTPIINLDSINNDDLLRKLLNY